MSYFTDKLTAEARLAAIIDACIHHLEAVRYSPKVSADERDRAVAAVQATLPEIRRYMTYFRTKELEASK